MAIAMLAPYVAAEYLLRQHGALIGPMPGSQVGGHWAGDYFLVDTIDATTYAIGEPRYYQGNYSYLIVGNDRAVLFDAGTGNRDIVPVVRALTALPVTVIPSHLHFDHVGALGRFERTALPDFPALRARAADRGLTLGRYEFLGLADRLPAPRPPCVPHRYAPPDRAAPPAGAWSRDTRRGSRPSEMRTTRRGR